VYHVTLVGRTSFSVTEDGPSEISQGLQWVAPDDQVG